MHKGSQVLAIELLCINLKLNGVDVSTISHFVLHVMKNIYFTHHFITHKV